MLSAMLVRAAVLTVATIVFVVPLGPSADAAPDIPELDIEPSCRAAEAAALVVGRTGDNCRADEMKARQVLADAWDGFSPADKAHCRTLVTTGGPPSYVEFLSCLEMSRDARRITHERAQRAADNGASPSETTGAGTATSKP